jgi:hypothetical protein
MSRYAHCQFPARCHHGIRALVVVLILALGFRGLGFTLLAKAQQTADEYSPARGRADVIAQGVVDLPDGDVLWCILLTRAPLAADAELEERPLGFVLATSAPLLLVDGSSGEQVRLGVQEAAFVRARTNQQRISLEPVSGLSYSIELLPIDTDAPAVPPDRIVYQSSAFPAPSGFRDLDLLIANETLTIPSTGSKSVILVIEGAANVSSPSGGSVQLLAGQAQSLSDEVTITAARSPATFVVALIGPEVLPLPVPVEASAS